MSVTDDMWLEELETVLENECKGVHQSNSEEDDVSDIARPSVWEVCLGVKNMESKMSTFDDIFDLPEQKILREDCSAFVSKLGNREEDKISVLSDLESILTYYCKAKPERRKYQHNNGWIDVLLPLITLKLPRSNTYNMFEAISEKYVPRHVDAFHLLHLLILYHDPQLCNYLDTKKVTAQMYADIWFKSLFASSCNLSVALSIWDVYFQKEEPFFIFFLCLVIVINARETILSIKDETKNKIADTIASLPCSLNVEDIADFCALAQYYSNMTPSSFKQVLSGHLFGECGESPNSVLSQTLCLPVSVEELIAVQGAHSGLKDDPDKREDCVSFFLIDCRTAEEYNAGHPPTAFHLDCDLMLREPSSFSTAVQGLLSCQQQALAAGSKAGGEHLCFLGRGDLLEDQYTHMVVASFLQKHTHYVSIVSGGYKAFHFFLNSNGDSGVDSYFRDHDSKLCRICATGQEANKNVTNKDTNVKSIISNGSITSSSNTGDVTETFSKIISDISNVVKTKQGKFYEYITNPISNTNRHVSSTDKGSKRYRDTGPVFSSDGDSSELESPVRNGIIGNNEKVVKLLPWTKRPDVLKCWECQLIDKENYMINCCLTLTNDCLIAVCHDDKTEYGTITMNQKLDTVLKITCRKKHPELVTFFYGDSSESCVPQRFLIPNPSEVTKMVSEQIRKVTTKAETLKP